MDSLEMFDMIQGLELEEIAENSLKVHEEDIAQFNRQQLYDGKRHDGQDIFPSYFEDPYFETREAAQAYSDWKDKITYSRVRTKGVPNLYINGFFHSSIHAEVVGQEVNISSGWAEAAPDIIAKYSDEIFGLNDEKREIFIDQYLEESFQKEVTEITGLNFTK